MASSSTATPARVPPRALLISGLALAVPVATALASSRVTQDDELLLWLLALVPAFLLSYYRGWRGAAAALAVGMAVLAAAEVAVLLAGRRLGSWPLFLGVVTAYVAICLGLGWLAELLHRQRAHAERLALTDELTGLPNRRHARAYLEHVAAAAERGRPLCLVLFDIDHFKSFNDHHGHAAGDAALRRFAGLLAHDTRRMDLSARYGGEEFLSILPGAPLDGGLSFAERVRASLRGAGAREAEFTVSVGVAQWTQTRAEPDALLAAADAALYRAKRRGRDCIQAAGEADGARESA